MSRKGKHSTASEYLRYLKGELSPGERHSLERKLQADPFEMEAMEGLESITPGQAEEDILALHARLAKRKSRRRRIAWYSAAASVASLLIIGTIFLQVYDFKPAPAEQTGLSLEERAVERDERPAEAADQADRDGAPPEGIMAPETESETDPVPAAPVKGAAEEDLQETAMQPETGRVSVPEPDEGAVVAGEAEPERILHYEAVAAREEGDEADERGRNEVVPEMEPQPDIPEPAAEQVMRQPQEERMAAPVAARPALMQKKAISDEGTERPAGGRVSGMVVSAEDQEPLEGVTVAFKGSNAGVVTNREGVFTLPVPDDSNRTIVASFVGMEPQEISLGGQEEIRLLMQPDPALLEEVVVISETARPMAPPEGWVRSAMPAGGFEAFKAYIEQHIQYPETGEAREGQMVFLRFTVTSGGKIRDVKALRSAGEAFTTEVIRLLREGPEWIPAEDISGRTDEVLLIRIKFRP